MEVSRKYNEAAYIIKFFHFTHSFKSLTFHTQTVTFTRTVHYISQFTTHKIIYLSRET